jgi:4-deoxy-L-threo-5-hexosulose-uronate ketol-isomerase
MQVKYHSHPDTVKSFSMQQLRQEFVADDLMQEGEIKLHYTIFDRFIYGSAVPVHTPIELGNYDALKADYFLERREMGVLNVGGNGTIVIDGDAFTLDNCDMLYVGRGVRSVNFQSEDPSNPARFYINSSPAHATHPTRRANKEDANIVELGDQAHANKRTIYQFIHEDGIQSCQLVMGYTELAEGNIWNTFPPHTHDRRMEVYFYFAVPESEVVMHFMGQPGETKHVALRNQDAVVSPPWSIHAGAGTSAYCFAWGMAGENQAFTDMDGVSFEQL